MALSLASSDFNVIPLPDATYLSETTKIPLVGPDFTFVTSITDGTLTANLSNPCMLTTVPGSWHNWSSPPLSESATPRVLNTFDKLSLEMDFSSPVKIFGAEMEGNAYGTWGMDAFFYDGATLVGSISRDVTTPSGALLFAGYSNTDSFDHVVLDVGSADAITLGAAEVRYSFDAPRQPVPEPGTCTLLGLGLVGLVGRLRRKK
jgi:hypothetical protein